jgi:hypothetical protein
LPCSDVFVCLTVCSSESSTTDPLQGRSIGARWSKAAKAAKADAPPSATSRRKAAAPKPAVEKAKEPQAKKAKKAADSASTPKQRKGKNKK